jgi:hypothetical protein
MDKLRLHLRQVNEAIAKNDVQGMIHNNLRRAGDLEVRSFDLRLNFQEIEEELVKSQRSYD